MEANELMIGDWVEVPFLEGKPKIVKVEEILFDEINPEWDGMENYGGIKIKYVEPIPLTPEILEKNGFTKGGMFVKTYYLAVEDFEIFVYFAYVNTQLIIEKRNGKEIINILNVEYLHILQHALKLCGIEKQIEL